MRLTRPWRDMLALIISYGLALFVGLLLFVLLMRLWPLTAIGILFYRGMAALIVVAPLVYVFLLAIRLPEMLGMNKREMIGCSITASALLCGAFILGPVTVDRSLSVFMLSRFYVSKHDLTKKQLEDAVINTYIHDWRQIDRRFQEQEVSGNIRRTSTGWRLTNRGYEFMRTAQFISELFDGDPRFVGRDVHSK